MTTKNLLLLSMIFLALTSCDIPVGSNSNWQDVVKAANNECPDITGTYSIMDQPGYLMLGGHYEDPKKAWEVMSITGNPQQELHITLYETNTGISYNALITRTRNKDYQCKDGMLETAWPYMDAPINRADESISNDDLVEKSLSFAKNKNGDLVLRTNTHTWKGIAVWCGDGCKYLPIPFTSRTHHHWSRWPSSAIPVATGTIEALNDKDIDNDIETTAPNDETPEGRVARLLKAMTRSGATLIKVYSEKNFWKATFRGTNDALLATHEVLQSTQAVQILNITTDSGTSSIKELQVELRVAPTNAEREAKQVEEENEHNLAVQHDAENNALVKHLLPSVPQGMTITASHHDANGFLVEVRHQDETAFYELIVKAIASGKFISGDIKARKPVDAYGKHIVDILFIPKSD